DDQLDSRDINLLAAAIRDENDSSFYDINGDGAVDNVDHHVWVSDVKRTYFGDANFDGEFNSTDLVDVFAAGQYEDDKAMNSTWATGDWNGDGEFDSSDMVTAFQDGGYEMGPKLVVSAVPEPSGGLLLMLLALMVVMRGRR
ncbi:MAG: hypothetical protein KDA87_27600, partial [Planctomycetales bacterium]|nr:hypothetical protein [Planctomycetales bacterium]